MQTVITAIPGYSVLEYLLVLQPHEELRAQIQSLQKEFATKYKAAQALQVKPQIALVNFYSYEMTQERIINRISQTADGTAPFKVELSGFGALPSHTIYARVTTKVPVKELVRELKSAQNLMMLNKEHKPHFIEDSHLVICRKLKPWQFEQGWLEYANRHFSGRFIADSMVLLKRPAGETGYQLIRRFAFESMAVNTKQGNLFGPLSTGGGT